MSDASGLNVVVDTNVHFSAWRTRNIDSPNKEIVVRGIRKHFQFAVSPALLAEVYEQMTETLRIPEKLAHRYIMLLRKAGRLYADIVNEVVWCSDPKDAYIFVLAHHSRAWCIVAFDNQFFEPTRLLSPVDFNCMRPLQFLATLRAVRGESPGRRSAYDGEMVSFTEHDGPASVPRPSSEEEASSTA